VSFLAHQKNVKCAKAEMSSTYWILNDDGEPEPIEDLLEWARWMERARRERLNVIAQDRDEQKGAPDVLVSTIFLALDHNHFGIGPPILYETMVLGGAMDGYQERYSTREAALAGHARACEKVRRRHRWKSPEACITEETAYLPRSVSRAPTAPRTPPTSPAAPDPAPAESAPRDSTRR
jgi:hypothetical protein